MTSMTKLAPYIVFEGMDGSGKTSQWGLAKDYLEGKGFSVLAVREPGTIPLGVALRDLLLNRKDIQLGPLEEVLLFSAARANLLRELVLPARRDGKIVLSDRSYVSTLAYQCSGGGVSLSHVEELSALIHRECPITRVLILDVPVPLGLERRGVPRDKIEDRGIEYWERVRAGFQQYVQWNPTTAVLLDGSGPVGLVQEVVRATIDGILSSENVR